MKILLIILALSTSVQADFFGDIGDWFEGAGNTFLDSFSECPSDSYFEERVGYCEPYEESKRTFVCTEETCTLRDLINNRQ
jgi:hypothetical protein